MTRLVGALGCVFLGVWVFLWWPGGFLLVGLGLVWLSLVRRGNEKGVR